MSRTSLLLSALAIPSMAALADEPAPTPITGKVCILEAAQHLPVIQGLSITKSVARAATPQESEAAWGRYADGGGPGKYPNVTLTMVEIDLRVAAQDVGVQFTCFSGYIHKGDRVLGVTSLGVTH